MNPKVILFSLLLLLIVAISILFVIKSQLLSSYFDSKSAPDPIEHIEAMQDSPNPTPIIPSNTNSQSIIDVMDETDSPEPSPLPAPRTAKTIGLNNPNITISNENAQNKPQQRERLEFKMTSLSAEFAGDPPPENKLRIESFFKKKNGDVKTCYQRVKNIQINASGRFVIAVSVSNDGSVMKVDKVEDQIEGELFTCIRQRIMNWNFGTLDSPVSFKKAWIFD